LLAARILKTDARMISELVFVWSIF